jgi:hypothetical protein
MRRRLKVNAMASARRKLTPEQWTEVEEIVAGLRYGRLGYPAMTLKDAADLVSEALAAGNLLDGVRVKVSAQTIKNRGNKGRAK